MLRTMPLLLAMCLAGPAHAGAGPAATEPAPRVYQEEFHWSRGGVRLVPVWRGDAPGSADMLAESGCRSLGIDCSDEPAPERWNMRYIKRPIRSGDYFGTARIVRMRQDRAYAKFTAPPGFTTCKAGIFLKDGEISRGATFAGAIQRAGLDGLAVYADLGPASAGPRRIEFRLLIQYVPDRSPLARRCWPDLTMVFLCRAGAGCRGSPSYPETDLR